MNLLNWLFKRKAEPPETPPEFLQDAPPDWLIDLKGQEFPGGNRFSIRAQLNEAARNASADIVVLPVNEFANPMTATAPLDRAELDRLLVILGFSFPQDIGEVAGPSDEGLPVTITIFHREPLAAQSATCNLAGWLDSRKSAPPVVDIGKILIEVKRRSFKGA